MTAQLDVTPIDTPRPMIAMPSLSSVPASRSVSIAEAASGITLDSLPERALTPEELVELASSIAADPSLWAEHVAYSDDRRHFVSLRRDNYVDVWVLCWTPANDTGWHDHDISSGAVAVVEGVLTEANISLGGPGIATDIPAGRVFGFGPEHIHRLTGSAPGSVSIHAYSPPLWRLGQYTVSEAGVLRRMSVSYADELRPLDDMI
jgi:hypothetical protein